MDEWFSPPEVAEIVPLCGSALMITQVDLTKMEGRFQLFPTVNEAREWKHENSLQSYPEWHKTECKLCRRRATLLAPACPQDDLISLDDANAPECID